MGDVMGDVVPLFPIYKNKGTRCKARLRSHWVIGSLSKWVIELLAFIGFILEVYVLGDVAQFLHFSFLNVRRKALGARENCLLSYPTFSFNQRRGLGFQALKRGT
jgi:hypothetical protein